MAGAGPGSAVGVAETVINWFDAGWAVYKEGVRDPEFFPPLGDMETQREWLGGFGAAWASDLDSKESVVDALARVLEGRAVAAATEPHQREAPANAALRLWSVPSQDIA